MCIGGGGGGGGGTPVGAWEAFEVGCGRMR